MCEALVPPSPSRNFRQGLLIAGTLVRLAPPHPPSLRSSPSGQGAASRPSGQGAAKTCSKPSAYTMIARLDYTRSCECTMHARRQAESLRSGVLLQRQLLCCRPGGACSLKAPVVKCRQSPPRKRVSLMSSDVNAATDDDPFRPKTHGFESWFSPKSLSTNYVRAVP